MKIKMICFLCLFALVASIGLAANMVIFDFDDKVPAAINFSSWSSGWWGGPRATPVTTIGVAAGGRTGNALELVIPFTAAGFGRDNIVTCDLDIPLDLFYADTMYVWAKTIGAGDAITSSSLTTTAYLTGVAGTYVPGTEGGSSGWWYGTSNGLTTSWVKTENAIDSLILYGYGTVVSKQLVEAVVIEFNMGGGDAYSAWVDYGNPGDMGPQTILWDDVVVGGVDQVPVTLLDWSLE